MKGFWEIDRQGKKVFWLACPYPATKKQMVEANEIKFWVETEGKGDPLILVHGGPGSNHCYFHPGMSILANKYYLVYYDLRGHYMSEEPKDKNDYGVLQDAGDIEALRKALNLEQINIFGHSYGGNVAFMYALMYPDNLNHVILCSTPVDWTDKDRDKLMESNPIAKKLDRVDYYKERGKWIDLYYKLYHYKPITQGSKYYNELFRKFYGAERARRILRAYDSDKTEIDWKRDILKINKPMLFLFGKHDPQILPDKAEKIISKVSNAKLVVLDESGHDPFTDEPEEFAYIVNEFLAT